MENVQLAAEFAEWSQWRAFRKPPSLFRMVPLLTPYDLPFHKWGSQMHPEDQLRGACSHLANMIEDIDKAAVCH